MAKQRIALLFGGNTASNDDYLQTIVDVAKTLEENLYEIILIGVTEKGKWLYYPGDIPSILKGEWKNHPDCCPIIFNLDCTKQGVYKILEDQSLSFLHLDCAFPLFTAQEELSGKAQGLLRLASIPFIGNSTISSAVLSDKVFAHTLATGANILTPRFLTVKRSDKLDIFEICEKINADFGFPVFVEPAESNMGISFVENEDELAEAIKTAFIYSKKVVIKERILGTSIKCAVLGNEKPEASILCELSDDKYLIPAQLDQQNSYCIRKLAVSLYRLFDCSGFAEIDFLVTPADCIYFTAIKSTPDLSKNSIFVELWESVGFSYADLLEKLINLAQEKSETLM